MAFATRAPSAYAEENAQPAMKDSKASNKSNLLAKRRAPLHDIGNIQSAASRNGKDAKDADVKQPLLRGKPATSSSSAASTLPAAPVIHVPVAPSGRPITRSQTKALQVPANAPSIIPQQLPVGRSLSGFLQRTAEAALEPTQPAVPPSPMPDIDSQDLTNPLAVADYVEEMFSFFRRAEPRFRAPADYMSNQADVNERMRAILVDWLVEVHKKFKLMQETLFLSVNLIDRFLALKAVTRKNLQLVGVSGMLMASKYEEIWAPEVNDFVYIADKAYAREQILGMEKLMCNTLRFEFTVPTPFTFLNRYLKAGDATSTSTVGWLAAYLIELALPDYAMLQSTSSLQAAAAVHLALRITAREDAFPRALRHHSRYTLADLQPCTAQLAALFHSAPTSALPAVFTKYSGQKLGQVALIAWPEGLWAELQQQ